MTQPSTDNKFTRSPPRQPAQAMERFSNSNSFQSLLVKLMQNSSAGKACLKQNKTQRYEHINEYLSFSAISRKMIKFML